mmetsp:Transcript_3910/g.9469  ORF Transcript_3910/g.9469 Transcript_3910/m.9469 type:complete len:472 (+) Transcript_3910:140-1555(+)
MQLRDVARGKPRAVGAHLDRLTGLGSHGSGGDGGGVCQLGHVRGKRGVAVPSVPRQRIGLRAVPRERIGAQRHAHHAAEVQGQQATAAGVDPPVHRCVLARGGGQEQPPQRAPRELVAHIVALACALPRHKVAPPVPCAVPGTVGVLARGTEETRRAEALPSAVVARTVAGAFRLRLSKERQEVPLALFEGAELVREEACTLGDAATGHGVTVIRVSRARRHRMLRRSKHDEGHPFFRRGDRELVARDGALGRRVAIGGAQPYRGKRPPHGLVQRPKVLYAQRDVDVPLVDDVVLVAGAQGAVSTEVGRLARTLPGAPHAARLARLAVVAAYLHLVARAAAQAVVGAPHPAAVVVAVPHVAAAHGWENARVAHPVALAVVPAPVRVHEELSFQRCQLRSEAPLIVPARLGSVRRKLSGHRRQALTTMVGDAVGGKHANRRRLQRPRRRPRPVVRDVDRHRQVGRHVGDDAQ